MKEDLEAREVAPWAVAAVGPAGAKRSFCQQTLSPDKRLFVDLYEELKEPQGIEWLVEGFLPLSYLAVLGGDSKCGKTWFVTALGLSVAAGEDFMGMAVRQSPVLWCSFEEGPVERHLAVQAYQATGRKMPEKGNFLTTYERVYIDDPYALQQIGEYAAGLGAGLIVIDPLHAAYGAGSIADGTTARRVLSGVKVFCRDLKVAVLVIHHLTKAASSGLVRERMSDSAQILAAASMDLLMEAEEGPTPQSPSPLTNQSREGDSSRTIRLVGRGRGAHVNREWLIESPAPMDYRLVESAEGRLGTSLERAILAVLAGPNGDGVIENAGSTLKDRIILSSREVAERIGATLGSVRNVLTRLVGRRQVRVAGEFSGARVYALPVPDC